MGKRLDITDQIYGRLLALVTDWYKTKETGFTHWFCQCIDNNIVSVYLGNLRNGNTQSCGCYNKEIVSEKLNAVDEIYGRLLALVTDWYKTNLTGETHWWCQCECNEIVSVSFSHLKSGHTQSCGCLKRELISERQKGENNSNWNGGKITIICKQCGREKEVIPSRGSVAQFCSLKCVGIWNSENRLGEDSPYWKNGITPLYKKIRTSKKYKEFVQTIFNEVNYTCQLSQEIGGELHAHHIKPSYKILEENNITTRKQALECKELWDEKNIVVLSEKWHLGIKTYNPLAFHKIYGTKNFTEENFYEWFKEFSTDKFNKRIGKK